MLNEKDKKIIEILKKDSRSPIREIAKKTKIRPSTVHQRIKKLIDTEVIDKFTVKLNDSKIGENFIVFMLIKGNTSEYLDNRILSHKNVKGVFGVTGEYDLLLKLKFKDVEEFNQFVLKFRKENKSIQSTLTMVGTATLKEEV